MEESGEPPLSLQPKKTKVITARRGVARRTSSPTSRGTPSSSSHGGRNTWDTQPSQ